MRSQSETASKRNVRYLPYAFTEQGVAMLSSVLSSKRAVRVNVEIMRAFVRMRQILAAHADLARKLDALEKRYDAQFKVVFEATLRAFLPFCPTEEIRMERGVKRYNGAGNRRAQPRPSALNLEE